MFSDLLDATGSEIYLKPVDRYLALGRETTFATAVEAALRRREVAIGYRAAARDGDRATPRLNPVKSERLTPAAGDCLIVLAEDCPPALSSLARWKQHRPSAKSSS